MYIENEFLQMDFDSDVGIKLNLIKKGIFNCKLDI